MLSPEKRHRHREQRLCKHYGQAGHFVSSCMMKGWKGSSLAGEVVLSSIFNYVSFTTIIDSGADGNIKHQNLALQLGITRVPLPQAVVAKALNGLSLGRVTYQTAPVCMKVAGTHQETIHFSLLLSPLVRILRYPKNGEPPASRSV